MKFDNIIIGGGLSGLVCGLRLQKAGKKCAIVSEGQNALHFFSGGFGLLSRLPDGTAVDEPLKAIANLESEHPYSKIGADAVARYAEDAKNLLNENGVNVKGSAEKNRFVISAGGSLKSAWLTIDDIASVESRSEKLGDKVLIVNIEGFLDFNTAFIAEALEKRGMNCRIVAVSTEETKQLRRNPSEMRSSNIAKVMENEPSRAKFVEAVKAQIKDDDCIVLPAVFGLKCTCALEDVRKKIGVKTVFIGTLTPSVAGIRIQNQLKKAFESAGGTFLMGDEVTGASVKDGKVMSVKTQNLEDIELTAENYILASGSYFGHGIVSDVDKVSEPIFGLDVEFAEDRNNWYNADFFAEQKFMEFGVKSGKKFNAIKDGVEISNLYVIGSVLGGFNPLFEGCGAGVAIMTAFSVSDSILSR